MYHGENNGSSRSILRILCSGSWTGLRIATVYSGGRVEDERMGQGPANRWTSSVSHRYCAECEFGELLKQMGRISSPMKLWFETQSVLASTLAVLAMC